MPWMCSSTQAGGEAGRPKGGLSEHRRAGSTFRNAAGIYSSPLAVASKVGPDRLVRHAVVYRRVANDKRVDRAP